MTYTPKMTIRHKFDQSELDRRIEERVSIYRDSVSDHMRRGAVISVFDSYALGFVLQLQDYITKGYTVHGKMLPSTQPQFSRAYLVKPEALQESDIKQIKIEVEQEYAQHLQAAYEQHKAAIVAESIQRYETEQRKKADAEKAKMLAKFEAEAIAVLGSAPIEEAA